MLYCVVRASVFLATGRLMRQSAERSSAVSPYWRLIDVRAETLYANVGRCKALHIAGRTVSVSETGILVGKCSICCVPNSFVDMDAIVRSTVEE